MTTCQVCECDTTYYGVSPDGAVICAACAAGIHP